MEEEPKHILVQLFEFLIFLIIFGVIIRLIMDVTSNL